MEGTTSPTRLSDSCIFQAQKDYYNDMGIMAWQSDEVPQLITSNCYIAECYASLIVGFYLDNQAKMQEANEPLYIIELGAGHGKFTFYLLKSLVKKLTLLGISCSTLKYVMTDISEKNLIAWQEHHALQEYFTSGILDCAIFDATSDTTIKLWQSNINLGPGSIKTQPIFIANYFFDSLPSDAFQIKSGILHETLISVEHTSKPKNSNEFFKSANYKFTNNAIDTNYYQDAELNAILEHYQQHFDNASFIIPVSSIECIKRLNKLAPNGHLLIVGDKGDVLAESFREIEDPFIPHHGSISVNLNFHALKQFYNGTAKRYSLLDPKNRADFHVGCFIAGGDKPLLRINYQNKIQDFGPSDFSTLCLENPENIETIQELNVIVAILKLSKWDPSVFFDFSDIIIDNLDKIDYEIEQTLIEGSELLRENFFLLETDDVMFEIGRMLYELDEHDAAIKFYNLSLKYFGRQPEVLYNIMLCLQDKGDESAGNSMLRDILAEYPDFKLAKEYKEQHELID